MITSIGPALNATFKLGQIPYFLGVGAKELMYDAKYESFDLAKKASTVAQKVFEVIKAVVRQIFNYATFHGFLMVGCGCCEIIATIHRLGILTIAANTLSVISSISLGCFGLANFLMVCEQIRILLSLVNIPDDAPQEVKDAVRSIKIGAIIALLSGICYLVGIALVLCGGPAAVVVLFMLLGLAGGGSKILYDMIVADKTEIINKHKILIKI